MSSFEGEAARVTDDDLLRQLAPIWAARWDGTFQIAACENEIPDQQGADGSYRGKSSSA